MGTSGLLILFVCGGLLLVVGMVAMGDFHAEANNSTDPTIQANADVASHAANPIFTVLAYICLAVAAIALLQQFRNL